MFIALLINPILCFYHIIINPTPIATPANEIDGILLARYLNPSKIKKYRIIIEDVINIPWKVILELYRRIRNNYNKINN